MSLARTGHSGGGKARGQFNTRGLVEAPATAGDGNTITKPGMNTQNLPADFGGLTGRKNPMRPKAGPAGNFSDVLTPGGQENP